MVEVFKTNVESLRESKLILSSLKKRFPFFKINFDLDDCDKVLRVEGNDILVEEIIGEMKLKKYRCERL